ncbi:MAG: 3-deoxy-D-manno-octulosonic acid transferase [Acidobacteriota bacterium]
MYALYSLASLLLFALAMPYFAYQALRYRKYVGSLSERLGLLPLSLNLDRDPSIWIHAVSVGEALTARAIAGELKARYPTLRLFISTTTMTGQQVARRSFQVADGIFYFPFDLPMIVNRVLEVVRPRLFVMMETEIWPNLLRACRQRDIRTIVINGRISARSYPRYRLVRPLFKQVLALVDRFCVQGEETAGRLVALGAPADRITITGSLKFDSLHATGGAAASGKGAERVLRFFKVAPGRPVIVAGSTMPGESEMVLGCFERIRTLARHPLLVIAPRKPEHFDQVERAARQAGFRTLRRSALAIDEDPKADVVILDTIGELAHLYLAATVVFVGGSLVDVGGHNILEPAIHGKPIVFGPHMENFAEIARSFLDHQAAIQVQTASELGDTLLALIEDRERRDRLGAAARGVVEANRGAKDRSLEAIAALLPVWSAASGNVVPFPSGR